MGNTTEKDRVKTGLSEVRSLVLGAQILLGFQYRAAFEPVFAHLSAAARMVALGSLMLLVASTACLIAPAPFHRIVARGQATARMERFTGRMGTFALLPFAVALGGNVATALAQQLGLGWAGLLGGAVAVAAGACWFGPALKPRRKPAPKEDEVASTKERITELLTEARIVLPGVQALLGFQFASYLTDAFHALSPMAKAVNTGSLLLLVVAMILLMMPAPFHRLVEGGENTSSFERAAERLVLAALVPLALAVAGDVFVIATVVGGSAVAAVAAAASAAGTLALWFGVPWLARRMP